jgi:hypothetical protein
MNLVLTITAQFPGHWLHEFRYVPAPLIFMLIPTIVKGLTSRLAADSVDTVGTMYEVTASLDQPAMVSWSHAVLGMSSGLGVVGTCASIVCTLWSRSCVRSTMRNVLAPFVLVWVPQWVAYWLLYRAGSSLAFVVTTFFDFVVLPLGAFGTFIGAGLASRNPAFAWTFSASTLVLNFMALIYSFSASTVISGPMSMKLAFIAMNPVIIELFILTPTRFVARSLRHNDPSTSFVCLTPFILFKQMLPRFIVATVSNPADVFLLSIVSNITDLLTKQSQRRRDRVLDNMWAKHFPRQGQTEATRMERTLRNRRLRATNAAFTSLSQILSIWNGVALVFALDISTNGSSPSASTDAAWAVVKGGLIQTATAIGTDYFSTIAVGITQGVNELEQVRGRRWMWSLCTAPMFVQGAQYLSHSLGGAMACRDGAHKSTWVFMGGDFCSA